LTVRFSRDQGARGKRNPIFIRGNLYPCNSDWQIKGSYGDRKKGKALFSSRPKKRKKGTSSRAPQLILNIKRGRGAGPEERSAGGIGLCE